MTTVQSLINAGAALSQGSEFVRMIQLTLSLSAGVCILGGLLRLCFGRGSPAVKAVFACIHISIIYLIVIVLYTFFPGLRDVLPALPFVTVGADAFSLWDLSALTADRFYPGLLQLFLLAFFVNLLEDLIPWGKKILNWYFFRLITACCALGLYTGISILISDYAPQVFDSWAAPILISVWLVIGILALSKGLLTLIAAAFNPVLGFLYSFFFSALVGKQFTKSIATCGLVLSAFHILYRSGFTGFAFSQISTVSYGPSCIAVLVSLFLFGRLL